MVSPSLPASTRRQPRRAWNGPVAWHHASTKGDGVRPTVTRCRDPSCGGGACCQLAPLDEVGAHDAADDDGDAYDVSDLQRPAAEDVHDERRDRYQGDE